MTALSPASASARWTIRAACRWVVANRLDLTVEGAEWIPPAGPALIASRHVHHLYDGCALIATLRRPTAILAAIDWARGPGRWLLEGACRWANWPMVIRPEALGQPGGPPAHLARRYTRGAARTAIDWLRAGRLLVLFPEAYPVIDPTPTFSREAQTMLPFRSGCAHLTERAERDGCGPVPIIPAGFSYVHDGRRWQVHLQFGPPHFATGRMGRAALLQALEAEVRTLSRVHHSAQPVIASREETP